PCVCNRRIFFMNASSGPKAAALTQPVKPAIPFDGSQPLWNSFFHRKNLPHLAPSPSNGTPTGPPPHQPKGFEGIGDASRA
ncbi:hypothetical protein ACP3WA_25995, partial [Salmonella enterica]|uniref:hypothetical protein n=1 Tax=Salmonella enterica TaxID=28901 RepID=UPI003CEDB5F1